MSALFKLMRSVGRKALGTRDDDYSSTEFKNVVEKEKDNPDLKDLVRRLRKQRMELTGNGDR